MLSTLSTLSTLPTLQHLVQCYVNLLYFLSLPSDEDAVSGQVEVGKEQVMALLC